MGTNKTRETDLRGLIRRVEAVLNMEIEALPDILQEVSPDKRIDFVSKILPVVIKYKESHSHEWDLPEWE